MTFPAQVGGDALALLQQHRGLARRDQAARPPDHDQHHGESNSSMRYWVGSKVGPKKSAEEIELAHDLGAADHRDGRDRHADLAAHAAEHNDRQDGGRLQEGEDSGEMKPCRVAKNEPAKPANIAPIAKAVSLVLVVLMPSERQAISSSRSASQARPTGSLRRRTVTAAVEKRERQDDVVEEDHAVERENSSPNTAAKPLSSALNGMPKKVGRCR